MSAECPTCGRDDFASEQGMKVHHKRSHDVSLVDTTECEHCGDEFTIVDYNKPNRYCSLECLHESNRSDNECAACGRQIPGAKTYCCHTCHTEAKLDRPRPEDVESLLWLLYRYEGFSFVETYRRQRAVLGLDECLTEDQTRDKIHDMGIARDYNSARWTLQDLEPDDVGKSAPSGDESYKQYYQEAQS